jgi:hypothetical protein
MKVWIVSPPAKPIWKVIRVIAGLLVIAVSLWLMVKLWPLLVIALSVWLIIELWPVIQSPRLDWDGSLARREREREYERKRAAWEEERKKIEAMLAKDPSRVRMSCERCGRLL